VARIRTLTVGLFLLAGVVGFLLPDHAHAATCDALVGKWAWFIGGEVTVNPDGTFTQQSDNAGTWECTDPARRRFTLRWRDGGFVNSLALSPDGKGLTSTDQSQWYVTAQRSAPGRTPVQLVRKGNCCQKAYACETKKKDGTPFRVTSIEEIKDTLILLGKKGGKPRGIILVPYDNAPLGHAFNARWLGDGTFTWEKTFFLTDRSRPIVEGSSSGIRHRGNRLRGIT
jgi:hypothetical protein